jgi:hypothetical protein
MKRIASGRLAGAVLAACMSAAAASCGAPVAPPATTPETDGAISWRLVSGPLGGGQDEVCGSGAPTTCVVAPSTAEAPRTAAFSLFLHAGAIPVTYAGTIRVGFIASEEREGYELRLDDYQVEPEAEPVGVAASGVVTADSGTYTIDVALDALTAGGAQRTIARTITVRVSGRTE